MNELPTYLFHQGTNYRAYEFMGSHFAVVEGESGVEFRVWAPNAKKVSVVGDFNGWNQNSHPMKRVTAQGVWEVFVPNLKTFDCYKYAVTSKSGTILKTDPYAFHCETSPYSGSKVYDLSGYDWQDEEFVAKRQKSNAYCEPMNIYEVNVASWMRYPDGNFLNYRDLADKLVPYVKEMGYTHVELMPITEYPFDGSWGYQVTGYFAVSSRFGTPRDFMYLIDKFHLAGIKVIIDWVPAHFPKDEHGLYEFDGGCLYEDSREKRMEHKGWGTRVFDYGRNEVQSFLISSAMFFFDVYHVDGIRVDAVASMLYLDYDRKEGEWEPNSQGGNTSLEAIAFLQKLNSVIFEFHPSALMIAEESTAFPLVTFPTDKGGLGFNFKWNMGWMNDVLSYCQTDPLFRKGNHNKLTFAMVYAFSENYILPISHDEVVHGKCSLINKMSGNYDEKFASDRAFMGYMISHPGKKLMFMGQEFGQFKEWDFREGLEFFMLDYPKHQQLHQFFKDINRFYVEHEAFYTIEKSWDGFEWLTADDSDNNTLVYLRKGIKGEEILVVVNFSGNDLSKYKIGVDAGNYEIVFNSDDVKYGGNGKIKERTFRAKKGKFKNKDYSICVDIPKFSFIYYKVLKSLTNENKSKRNYCKSN